MKYKKPRYGNRDTAKSWEATLCESMLGAHGPTGKNPHLIPLMAKDLSPLLRMVKKAPLL
jgi:hypothetical protein